MSVRDIKSDEMLASLRKPSIGKYSVRIRAQGLPEASLEFLPGDKGAGKKRMMAAAKKLTGEGFKLDFMAKNAQDRHMKHQVERQIVVGGKMATHKILKEDREERPSAKDFGKDSFPSPKDYVAGSFNQWATGNPPKKAKDRRNQKEIESGENYDIVPIQGQWFKDKR